MSTLRRSLIWAMAHCRYIARFYPDWLVSKVVDISTLNIRENNPRHMREGVINIFWCFCGRLEENQFIAFGELHPLLVADFSVGLQILLVSDEHDCHSLVGMLQHLLQPSDKVLESVASCDIIDKQGAYGPSIVRTSNASKTFLTSRVPYLKLHSILSVNLDSPGAKFDADCKIMRGFESFVRKLEEQARFTDGRVADDNVLENVGIAWHIFQ